MNNKLLQELILLAFVLIAPNAFSENTSPTDINGQAVEVSIGSIGGEMDRRAYRKLRKLLGEAVAKNVIDKIVIYSNDIEGGFFGCVEKPPSKTNAGARRAFEKFFQKLGNIQPKDNTVYQFKRVNTCSVLSKVDNQKSITPKLKCNNQNCPGPNMVRILGECYRC